MTVTPELFTAKNEAEAQALTAHRASTCHLSEWSCSYCESEAVSATVSGPA